jgi:hypothetical protein
MYELNPISSIIWKPIMDNIRNKIIGGEFVHRFSIFGKIVIEIHVAEKIQWP